MFVGGEQAAAAAAPVVEIVTGDHGATAPPVAFGVLLLAFGICAGWRAKASRDLRAERTREGQNERLRTQVCRALGGTSQ
jgi:hypothetical protein